MNERLKELAEQAGMYYRTTSDEFCEADKDGVPIEMMERFAELVRQDEREACAKLLETQIDFKGLDSQPQFLKFALDLITGCANLIRARGNHEQD
jgi:hypothetical protein